MADRALFRDNSIASLTGASQQALAKNGNRGFLAIQNTGTGIVSVNLTGGTAANGGSGCIDLAPKSGSSPGGSIVLDHSVPQNAIFVIGAAGQPLSVIEG